MGLDRSIAWLIIIPLLHTMVQSGDTERAHCGPKNLSLGVKNSFLMFTISMFLSPYNFSFNIIV